MNDDYLWDRSGEPDPEIQKLEQVLGTLRYQPQPLEIPANLPVGRRREFFPWLAIAATIAVAVIGLGIWLGMNRQQTNTQVATEVKSPAKTSTEPTTNPTAKNAEETTASSLPSPQKQYEPLRRHRFTPGAIASRTRNAEARRELAAIERKEAEAAKVQLMLALRVASTKLVFAQKKTQGNSSENLIHNQHKIG